MSVFAKVTNSNHLPALEEGRLKVYSKQFNALVSKLNSLFTSEGVLTADLVGDVTGGVNLTVVPVADLGDAADAVNTAGKVIGKIVVGDDGLIYSALGTSATSVWAASDGASDITPS
jgi:hypothetical protein